MNACHLCRHPRGEHEHFSPTRSNCSRRLPDGTWCTCGHFEGRIVGSLWDALVWVAEHWPRRWR